MAFDGLAPVQVPNVASKIVCRPVLSPLVGVQLGRQVPARLNLSMLLATWPPAWCCMSGSVSFMRCLPASPR